MEKKEFKWIAFLTYAEKDYGNSEQKIRKRIYFLYELEPYNAEFRENDITFFDMFWNVFDRISHAVFHQLSPEVLQNTISIHIKKVEVKEFDISEFEKKVLAMNE